MKRTFILISLCLLFARVMLHSQSLHVFDIYPYDFPVIEAGFYAFDENGDMIFDLSVEDFSIYEDDEPVEVIDVDCSEGGICPGSQYSAILAIDISRSTQGYALTEEKKAAQVFIDGLPGDGSECAITAFNHDNFLVHDFSINKEELTASFESLSSDGGTDYNAAFLEPEAGALLVAENAKFKDAIKIIIVSDGRSSGDADSIVAVANALGAKIFAVITSGYKSDFLEEITMRTGGFCFHVGSGSEAEIVFNKLSQISRCSGACTIKWSSSPACNYSKWLKIELLRNNTYSQLYYSVYYKSRISYNISPSSFILQKINKGAQKDTSFTIYNNLYPVTIEEIISTNPAFKILNANTPFQLSENESKQINIRYEPQLDTCESGQIIVKKDYCGNDNISLLSYDTTVTDTIRVIFPNGKERLLSGGDTTLHWSGNPLDSVMIEYSTDGGTSWNIITEKAKGLEYKWNIPAIVSDSCLLRITKLEPNENLSHGMILGYGQLNCFDLSPDEKKLVSAGGSGYLYIRDLLKYEIIDTIGKHDNIIRDVKWSPDGTKLASCGDDNKIKIWDVDTGEELITFSGHTHDVNAVSWHPDGRKIVSASDDKSLKIWDLNNKGLIGTLTGHQNYVVDVKWSPDGSKIASSSDDNTIKIWDAVSGSLLHTLEGHDGTVYSIDWNNTSDKLVSGSSDYTIKTWDIQDGTCISTFVCQYSSIYSVDWNPDASEIVYGNTGNDVQIISAANGNNIASYKGHMDDVRDACFSKYDNKIYSFSYDQTIRIWDMSSQEELKNFTGHDSYISALDWNIDSIHIVSGSKDYMRLWELKSYPFSSILSENSNAYFSCAEFNSIGSQIISAAWYEDIQIWDVQTNELQNIIKYEYIYTIGWNKENNKIAAGGSTNKVYEWDAPYNFEAKIIASTDSYIQSIAWNPQNNLFACPGYDDTLCIWDSDTWQRIISYATNNDILSLDWNPFGNLLASGSYGIIDIWNTNTGNKITTIDCISSSYDLRWSPDGTMLACGCSYDDIMIWDMREYKLIDYFDDFNGNVNSVAWHPNSKWIAGGSSDGTIRIFQVRRSEKQDVSDTLWSIVKPDIFARDIDMGEHCVPSDEAKELTFEDFIINQDVFDIVIDSVIISDGDAGDFSITSTLPVLPCTLKSGDSLSVIFAFRTETAGEKSSFINIYYKHGTIQKQIFGTGIETFIEKRNDPIDFEKVCIDDSLLIAAYKVLKYTGTDTLLIDSTVNIGPDTTKFSILNGGGAFKLAPGEEHDIMMKFTPETQGEFSCTIAFYHRGLCSPEKIKCIGEGIVCGLTVPDSIEMLLDSPCDDIESLDTTISIKNDSEEDLRIDSIVISPAAGPFQILSQISFPFVIQANSQKELDISFIPVDTGAAGGLLTIFYNHQESPSEIILQGYKTAIGFYINPESYFVSKLIENERRTVYFTLYNTGTEPLSWPQPAINFGDDKFTIIAIEPNPTPAGDSSVISVRFEGGNENEYFSGYYVFADTCSNEDTLLMKALVKDISDLALKTEHINAEPGMIVQVPLYLSEAAAYMENMSEGIYTELSFNANLLFPEENSQYVYEEVSVEEDNKYIRNIKLFLPSQIFSGERLFIPMLAALGDSDSTGLILSDSATYFDDYTPLKVINGSLKIQICEKGGKRLISSDNPLALEQNQPNPARLMTKINYSVMEEGYYELNLYDIYGNKAFFLDSGCNTGSYSVDVDLSSLSNGIYIYRLTGKYGSLSRKMIVINN